MAEVNIARGTTPYLRFKLPIPISDIAVAYVTMKQNGNIVIDKELKDCDCGAFTIDVHLTQAETLMLNGSSIVEIQLRVRRIDGEAFKSRVYKVLTEDILKDGEI